MSMQDPLADMLTRIRNALAVRKSTVAMPASRLKEEVCRLLAREGYIESWQSERAGNKSTLLIRLKYRDGAAAIESLHRVSRPGLRRYVGVAGLPSVCGGLGTAIMSTSQGIVTEKTARAAKIGGEVLCTVF